MDNLKNTLIENGFSFARHEVRPWGAFWEIVEQKKFTQLYFPDVEVDTKFISPKILYINPKSRLSWQYHNRRKEIWKVVQGPVGIITSDTNEPSEMNISYVDDIITIDLRERHRIVRLDSPAIIAEIWCHCDEQLSDENDIVRIDDDYKR